jgi:hypothetical protein
VYGILLVTRLGRHTSVDGILLITRLGRYTSVDGYRVLGIQTQSAWGLVVRDDDHQCLGQNVDR